MCGGEIQCSVPSHAIYAIQSLKLEMAGESHLKPFSKTKTQTAFFYNTWDILIPHEGGLLQQLCCKYHDNAMFAWTFSFSEQFYYFVNQLSEF